MGFCNELLMWVLSGTFNVSFVRLVLRKVDGKVCGGGKCEGRRDLFAHWRNVLILNRLN